MKSDHSSTGVVDDGYQSLIPCLLGDATMLCAGEAIRFGIIVVWVSLSNIYT